MIIFQLILVITMAPLLNLSITEVSDQKWGQEGKDYTQVELAEESPVLIGANTSLSTIKVYLIVKQHQPDATKGLQASAVFRNEGSQPVSFHNPKDSTRLEILTKEGWPVRFPLDPPEALIHRVPTTEKPKPAIAVRIEPGGEYRLNLDVVRVYPIEQSASKLDRTIQNPAPNNATKATVFIPSGKYSVRLRTVLIPDSVSSSTARKLSSKSIEIHLGQ